MEPTLYTVAEVAKILKCNPTKVYELRKAGLLRFLKLGCLKCRRETLEEFLQKYENDFEKNLVALNALMQNAYIVGKNSKKFDIPFINAFLYKHAPELDIELLTMRLDMKAYNGGSVIYNNNVRDLDIQSIYVDRFKSLYRDKYSVRIGNPDTDVNTFVKKIMDSDFLTNKEAVKQDVLQQHAYRVQEHLGPWDYYFDKPMHDALKPRAMGTLEQYVDVMPNGKAYVDSVYESLEKDRVTGAHGALYDVVATYIIWLDAMINKLI